MEDRGSSRKRKRERRRRAHKVCHPKETTTFKTQRADGLREIDEEGKQVSQTCASSAMSRKSPGVSNASSFLDKVFLLLYLLIHLYVNENLVAFDLIIFW